MLWPWPQGHINSAHFGGSPTRYSRRGCNASGNVARVGTRTVATMRARPRWRRRQALTSLGLSPTAATADPDVAPPGLGPGRPGRYRNSRPSAGAGFGAALGV